MSDTYYTVVNYVGYKDGVQTCAGVNTSYHTNVPKVSNEIIEQWREFNEINLKEKWEVTRVDVAVVFFAKVDEYCPEQEENNDPNV
jgi:hypothetical protein